MLQLGSFVFVIKICVKKKAFGGFCVVLNFVKMHTFHHRFTHLIKEPS